MVNNKRLNNVRREDQTKHLTPTARGVKLISPFLLFFQSNIPVLEVSAELLWSNLIMEAMRANE